MVTMVYKPTNITGGHNLVPLPTGTGLNGSTEVSALPHLATKKTWKKTIHEPWCNVGPPSYKFVYNPNYSFKML